MLFGRFKRYIAFFLTTVAVASLFPFLVSAAGEVDDPKGISTEILEENKLDYLQAEMDTILVKYLGTADLTEDEVIDKVCNMMWDDMEAALVDRDNLEPAFAALSDDEFAQLEANYANADTLVCFYETIEQTMAPAAYGSKNATYTSDNGLPEGVTVAVATADSASCTSGKVTVAVKGSSGFLGIGKESDTATITITNSSGSEAALSFTWSSTSVNSMTIQKADGTKTTKSGTLSNQAFNDTLSSTDQVIITITTAQNSTENKVVLSDFGLVSASTTFKYTINYDNTKGSVTLDGNSVNSGTPTDVSASGGVMVATPKNGASFVAWLDSNNKVLSTDTTFLVPPTSNYTVTAQFDQNAWFMDKDTSIAYSTLTAAVNSSAGTIVLLNSGTLPALTDDPLTTDVDESIYTIPAGVTLLIPYDAANTLCTDKPTVHDNAYTKPTVYRTLTMASGANITVNGAISVSGSQSSKYAYNGMPSGPLGFIEMNSGSKITVESGANLYVWGYIKGSGSVEINSGGNVHECFQIADYRGGDVTRQMTSSTNSGTYGVFPFNQYYLQNVEVPMTLRAGAKENGYGSVYVTVAGTQEMSIPFIGSEKSMFIITDGYIVKDYIEGTGRTEIRVYGTVNITEVSIGMKVSLVGEITIDTSKYALPIPHHFTVSVESGSINMNQSIAFLPGSELYIKEDTSGTLGAGKKVYVYDLDQWLYNDGANGYSGTTNLPYMQLKYVPGGDGTTGRLKDALIQVDGTVDASAGAVYVTDSGANIYSTGTGKVTVAATTNATAYQVTTGGSDGTDITGWPVIAMQPAWLYNEANAYPAYADTAEVTEVTTYNYVNGYWHKGCTGKPTTTTVDATCESEGSKVTQCTCKIINTTEILPALGHTEVVDAAVAATCTTPGKTEGKHCSVCNAVIVPQEDIPTLSHSYTSVVTKPTCTTAGYTTHTCIACGDSYTDTEVPANGHNWGDWSAGACSICVVSPASSPALAPSPKQMAGNSFRPSESFI